jgi:hypothetical protein
MGRAILSTILAVIYLAASVPQAAVALESSDREVEAKLRSLPLGTAVEIRLGDQHYRVTGRIREVTDKRLVLDQGTTTGEYTISEITSVQRYVAESNHLELSSNALGAVVLNENIKVMTRDGGYVERKVVQATEERLLLDVHKSDEKSIRICFVHGYFGWWNLFSSDFKRLCARLCGASFTVQFPGRSVSAN